MKKRIMLILLTVLLVFTLVGTPALAKDPDKEAQGQPFQELWEALDEAVAQMEQLIDDVRLYLEEMISDVEADIEAMVAGAIENLQDQLDNLQEQLDDEEAARIAGDQAVASAAQAANDALQTLLDTAIAQGDAATAGAAQDANDALQTLLDTAMAEGDVATADAAQAANDALKALLEADIGAEEAARIAADNTLQDSIDYEGYYRIYEDNSLQNQINSIVIPEFGARSYKSPNVTYTAATDGIVSAWVRGTDSSHYDRPVIISGIIITSNKNVAMARNQDARETLSITFPVRKGERWRVVCTYPYTFDIKINWVPVGN